MLPVESFVLMLFGVVKYIKKTKCKPIGIVKFNSKEIKYLLNESWPLLISAFAWLLATKSNQFIIERYVDNYWLGQYSAAMQLSDIFNIFPVIVGVAMMPKALKNKGNKEAYFNIFKTIYRICIAYSLVVIVLISMGADNLTVLLLGEKYLDSVKFLKISVFSILFTSLITINGYYFIAEGRQWVLMQRHIMFAAMNVCGNIFLIPGYGVEVGMYYTLLLYMFHSIILDFIGVKNKKLNNVKVSELLMRWMWK
jgi:PST family polysaccharide transporter